MSFKDCINAKIKANLLTPKQVDQLFRKYDSMVNVFKKNMNDDSAAIEAASRIVVVEAEQIAIRKRNTIKAALAQSRITKDLEKRASLIDKKGVFFERDEATRYAMSVQDLYERTNARHQTVRKQFISNLDKFIVRFASKFGGIFNKKEGLTDIVREVLGQSTGNSEASQFAKAVAASFDISHSRYKAAGGSIGKLKNYFPQVHKRERIKQVSFEEWHDFLRPKLNTDDMLDVSTGLPITDEKLFKIMKDDYESIVTNGASELRKRADEGKVTFGLGSEVSVRRESSRFFKFKTAEDFLEYNNKFGNGDEGIFDSIIGHLDAMAKDTAVLEILGPKPNAMQRHLDLQMSARQVGKVRQNWTNGMYDILVGNVDGMANDSKWFSVLGNVQNIIRSSVLGSASISAISDNTFIIATAKMNGFSGTKALKRYYSLLNPFNKADRELAIRSGYVADIAIGKALTDLRFTGDAMGGEVTRKLAEFTNRASGLHSMTKAGSDAISLEFEATLADLVTAKTSWADIDPDFRRMAEAFGLSENDWKIISTTELFINPDNGVKFLRSSEIALNKNVDSRAAIEIASKIDDWNFTMRNVATNEASLRTRSITTGAAFGDARKGTVLRAFASSFFMFKTFPITVMFNHIIPSITAAKQGKFQHAATVAVGTTLLGAVAIQLKEIVKGRKPRDTSDWKFWQAAMMQGGGLGLFGDFLFNEYSRFGRDPIFEALGPIAGLGSDVARTFKGNLERGIEGKDTKFTKDLFRLAKRNIPAVSLWYSRLFMERLLLDQMERMVDPKFEKNVRRMERRTFKRSGQKYWWRKGKVLPFK